VPPGQQIAYIFGAANLYKPISKPPSKMLFQIAKEAYRRLFYQKTGKIMFKPIIFHFF
jgi:hypothetical protein